MNRLTVRELSTAIDETPDPLRGEVLRLIEQHRAATPGSLTQSLIGRKIVSILAKLGYYR